MAELKVMTRVLLIASAADAAVAIESAVQRESVESTVQLEIMDRLSMGTRSDFLM